MKIYSMFLGLVVSLLSICQASASTLLASSYTTGNVLKFDATTGAYQGEFIAAASSGGLAQPQGFTFGNDGKFYISSFGTSQIKRYDANTGTFIDNFASTPSGSRGLAFDDTGKLYSAYGSSVTRFDASGTIDAGFTHTFGATATGVLQGADDNIYVSWGSNSILGGVAQYNVATSTWNDTWRTGGITGQAWYMAMDASGTLYLGASGANSIYRDNGSTWVPFTATTTDLDRPRGLTFDPAGDLLVGGFGGVSRSNILKFDGSTGTYNGVFATGGGLDQPFYLGIAPVPAPAAIWLLGTALAGLGVIGRRKQPFAA
jgi:hypothetical protein